jgi:hypothetical protein
MGKSPSSASVSGPAMKLQPTHRDVFAAAGSTTPFRRALLLLVGQRPSSRR